MSRIYNLQKDAEDSQDFYAVFGKSAGKLPSAFDLRKNCPPVWDQGNEGSCTSHAGCACRVMLAGDPELDLSRAFLYYQERVLEGTTGQDAGATMRDICKAAQKFGVCPSPDMPYVAGDYKQSPSAQAYRDALPYRIQSYQKVQSINDIKQSLVTRVQPVLVGMKVFESMESDEVAKSGVLPMPKRGEQEMGGHAVLIVGYQDGKPGLLHRFACIFGCSAPAGNFIVRNSWGTAWGQDGYFLMPYAYLERYAYDFWIMM